MARLLVVSNRLPVTVTRSAQGTTFERSAGGLATGLGAAHAETDGLWIGWPGDAGALDDERAELTRALERLRCVPVWLDPDEVRRYYEGVSNGALWPLFHYLLDQVPLVVTDWDVYERVNERFADVVAAHYRPGDLVWVHDYQLLLLPHFLRQRLPNALIGFFLHIPFPASEVFRTFPFAGRVLEGVLGADLVGFHTSAYMRHFSSALLRVLGLAPDVDRVRVGDRQVLLGSFPMGIDAGKYEALGSDPEVVAEAARLHGPPGTSLVVGIDRLDYTKGIPRRLLAFEAMLRQEPALRERVRLVQVAVPSRTSVVAYQEFRQSVDGLVGRINGAFATPHWVPVHYMYRALSEREVAALYRAADVMLVTPLRDGMNLVAKEFVAARGDEDGVLVLSEFAGAAAELAEALLVNPYDVNLTAEVLQRALSMAEAERRTRMRGLRRRVRTYDMAHWVRSFTGALAEAGAERRKGSHAMTTPEELDAVVERLRRADYLLLLLDYDGTLVPFAALPELAAPDAPLVDLLRRLAARARTAVHVVSGRTRETVERWLGDLPIGLHAEHGFWSRSIGAADWSSQSQPPTDWRDRAREILEQTAARTPGSLVEEKTIALAWHYRMADPEFGARQANELRIHLTQLLSNAPVEITTGVKVVEVRPHGVHKGTIVASALALLPGATVAAFGDDLTDEDLFGALPEGAVAVHVGPGPSRANVYVPSVAVVRRVLSAIAAGANGR